MAYKTIATCDACGKEVNIREKKVDWIELHVPVLLLPEPRRAYPFVSDPVVFMVCSRGCAHDVLDKVLG